MGCDALHEGGRQWPCPSRVVRVWEDVSASSARFLPAATGHDGLRHLVDLMADFERTWCVKGGLGDIELDVGDVLLSTSLAGVLPVAEKGVVLDMAVAGDWPIKWGSSLPAIARRRIPGAEGWGAALSSSLQQLTPEFWTSSPISASLLADNLGTLLALLASPTDPRDSAARESGALRIGDRVEDAVRQRASEPGLTAADVAQRLGVSERTLHRALSSRGQTFSRCLAASRIELAKRMLEAPAFEKLSIGEIGRRAGYADPSYFVRAVLKALGATPSRYRESHRR